MPLQHVSNVEASLTCDNDSGLRGAGGEPRSASGVSVSVFSFLLQAPWSIPHTGRQSCRKGKVQVGATPFLSELCRALERG